MNLNEKKILFADLDGTLITTASGKTFAEDWTDFRIRKEVLDKIKALGKLQFVYVVSNQGGIPEYISEEEFLAKLNGILEFVSSYTDIVCDGDFCVSMDKGDLRRKPNVKMLEDLFVRHEGLSEIDGVSKTEMLMIGDASGKEGQFSDSDKKCAENFGIDYLDVEDFLNT